MLYFQESPASDEVEKSDVPSSDASTPLHEGTYVPFQPVYTVSVSDPVKNGDIVQYTVMTTKLADDTDVVVVTRQYEDFEYLHHCLQAQNPNDGLIVSSTSHYCVFIVSAVCVSFYLFDGLSSIVMYYYYYLHAVMTVNY